MENLKMLETFNKLQETLGKEATENLVALYDLKLNEMKENLATKADIARLETMIAKLESANIKWFIGTGITFTLINFLLEHFM